MAEKGRSFSYVDSETELTASSNLYASTAHDASNSKAFACSVLASFGEPQPISNPPHQYHHNSSNIMSTSQSSSASLEFTPAPLASAPLPSIAAITSVSSTGQAKNNINIARTVGGSICRFPKLEECAHFHYERVQLGKLQARLVDDRGDQQSNISASQQAGAEGGSFAQHQQRLAVSNCWFIIKVSAGRSEPFLIRRSLENLRMLDEMLHRCVYDRKISGLSNLDEIEVCSDDELEDEVLKYLNRFSIIASDSLTCGPVLTWFQIDNKGRRLPLADTDTQQSINTPAVGAAYGVRRYVAQACDEISIEVGDMISVIDMPSPAESVWWRGKKSHLQKSIYEVGFFPQSCVATIGDKIPRHLPLPAPMVGSLAVSPTKPVLRKHGKLIAFFRSFILARPSRRRLKQSGIYKERVFSCDLSEHLLNSGQDIPMVLKCCAEFIEENGIVDGIYRLSGITSNIQKLRRAFDEERIPDLTHPDIKQDIHAVSSLLKMYFRELPNPLCTYQLYEHFVDAIQTRSDSGERLRLMKETVQKLPPPHYRTLKYLALHLNKIAHNSANTGMTDRNLAIVWAPNLLRSPALESGGVAALRGVGVQAVVTEYLITNCNLIFDSSDDFSPRYESLPYDSLTDSDSIQVEQRDHELSLERPKSLSVGGAKLISLEEAQVRHNRLEMNDLKTIPINTPAIPGGSNAYIEVGGGPSSLPDKYHTVLPVPRSWQKRKTHSWKSLFTRTPRQSNSNQDIKNLNSIQSAAEEPAMVVVSPPADEEQIKYISLRGGDSDGFTKQSIDNLDGKALDMCPRSSSAESLRTAGHSRSVSHDSYFDLLQSPLRNGANCTSRELSELGLNFDREEPEMRIFSESESLVSSPRVSKEASRRAARQRNEDGGITGNSINPSPKKQPRLNPQNSFDKNALYPNPVEESRCKRYKLEDQLSDIQFIDCNTPEHMVNSVNTVQTSVQVHSPPKSDNNVSVEIPNSETVLSTKNDTVPKSRYSYPGNQFDNLNKSSDSKEGRFSYPGVSKGSQDADKKYVCRFAINNDVNMRAVDHKLKEQHSSVKVDESRNVNLLGRLSYCDPTNRSGILNPSASSLILRSNSAEISKPNLSLNTTTNEMITSKLSVATPSSPIQSPRYSLLVGETSSENSSSVNTPIYEMDASGQFTSDKLKSTHENAKDFMNLLGEESDSAAPHETTHNETGRDLSTMKRELSLDLECASKMSVDDISVSSNNKQIINIPSTPNTPNYTQTSDNTSQSMTPSEFGYHHLNRQSCVVSAESSPKSDLNSYDMLEQAFTSYDKKRGSNLSISPCRAKPTSPIKATISITYNIKSPVKKTHEDGMFTEKFLMNKSANSTLSLDDLDSPKTLLETSFDENMVYEQVKFFRQAISEVNDMLDNGNGEKLETHTEEDPKHNSAEETSNKEDDKDECKSLDHSNAGVSGGSTAPECDDIQMSDHDLDIQDSLEMDHNVSLYENVEVKRPISVYENVDVRRGRANEVVKITKENTQINCDNRNTEHKKEDSKPSNFIVRQLATKFELSPDEQVGSFDFSKSAVRKSSDNQKNLSPAFMRIKSGKQLNNASTITRSLDENAFVREFGQKKLESIAKSTHQFPDIGNILTENNPSRRKSLEFIKPKSLNPPKRLPELSSVNKEYCKTTESVKSKPEGFELKLQETTPTNVVITPTTENRISLIQHNVLDGQKPPIEDEKSASSLSSIKVLGSCKLDRERIERIKEERRLQFNEKYRSESFRGDKDCKVKSKSKTELRDLRENEMKISIESTRKKSKSRGDVTNYKGDREDFISTSCFTERTRRISDEKNQNDCLDYVVDDKVILPPETGTTQARKIGRLDLDLGREREQRCGGFQRSLSRESPNSEREKISPQFSIRDVTAMFESRLQNQ